MQNMTNFNAGSALEILEQVAHLTQSLEKLKKLRKLQSQEFSLEKYAHGVYIYCVNEITNCFYVCDPYLSTRINHLMLKCNKGIITIEEQRISRLAIGLIARCGHLLNKLDVSNSYPHINAVVFKWGMDLCAILPKL